MLLGCPPLDVTLSFKIQPELSLNPHRIGWNPGVSTGDCTYKPAKPAQGKSDLLADKAG